MQRANNKVHNSTLASYNVVLKYNCQDGHLVGGTSVFTLKH